MALPPGDRAAHRSAAWRSIEQMFLLGNRPGLDRAGAVCPPASSRSRRTAPKRYRRVWRSRPAMVPGRPGWARLDDPIREEQPMATILVTMRGLDLGPEGPL